MPELLDRLNAVLDSIEKRLQNKSDRTTKEVELLQ